MQPKASVAEEIPGFYDTAKYLIKRLNVMLMLDVSEEEVMDINIVR